MWEREWADLHSVPGYGFTVVGMGAPGIEQGPGWAPAACTLPTAERPLRRAEFEALFTSAVRGVERPEPGRLRLELEPTPEVAAQAAELVTRETACCSFFTFVLTATGGRLRLEVAVPAERVVVLDAVAALAGGGVRGSV